MSFPFRRCAMPRFELTQQGSQSGSLVQVEARKNNPSYRDMARTWKLLESFMSAHSIVPGEMAVAEFYDFIIMMLRASKR